MISEHIKQHLKNETNTIYETIDGLYEQVDRLSGPTGIIYARIDDGVDRIVSVPIKKY